MGKSGGWGSVSKKLIGRADIEEKRAVKRHILGQSQASG